jgi:hypothetical protein
MDKEAQRSRHTQRDREVLIALGTFLIVLSVPVLIGTFFEEGLVPSIVNVVAGLVILGIGAGMVWRGRRPAEGG